MQPAVVSPPGHELTSLLETERRLEQRLAVARQDAAALVAAAEAEATARLGTLEGELAAAEADARRRFDAERERRIATIAAEADRNARDFDQLPPDRFAALVDYVTTVFLEAEAGTP